MNERIHSEAEQALLDTARRVLPGGNFGNLAGDIVIREGRGGRVRDVSGNEYVDFLLGSGPMFIGHAHPEVVAAVQAQIPRGTTFFANNGHGIQPGRGNRRRRRLRRKGPLRQQRNRGRRLRHAPRPRLPQAATGS